MSAETKQQSMAEAEDSIELDEAGKTRLPIVDILTGRGAILGKSGSGKSNSASVIAEELLDRGFPLLIVDTDGEYWGLKETYELLHVGADEECDLQVGPEHAEKLAELALEQNVPIILDVSGYLDAEEASALVRETTAALFNKEKRLNKPFLLLVEEIHEYIPEGGGLDETGEWLIRVAKRGRKRGLGLCGISQRPANVKKDFLTQADWMLWHRLTWENDTAVVRRVVGSGYDDQVQDLSDGEAILMADFLEEDRRSVQVRRKNTFDAGATPDLGEFERPELKSVSGDLVGELEEISQREQSRQDRIEQLEDRLAEKDDRIEELEQELKNAQDVSNAATQLAEALQSGANGDAVPDNFEEQIAEKNQRIHELETALEDREQRISELESELESVQVDAERVEEAERIEAEYEELRERIQGLAESVGVAPDGGTETTQQQRPQQPETLETDVLENRAVERYLRGKREKIESLSETKREMLRYYVMNGSAEASEAYKYAGNSPTSSRRNTYSRELEKAGFIANEGGETYSYALRETVCDEMGDGFNDDELETIWKRLDRMVDEKIVSGK